MLITPFLLLLLLLLILHTNLSCAYVIDHPSRESIFPAAVGQNSFLVLGGGDDKSLLEHEKSRRKSFFLFNPAKPREEGEGQQSNHVVENKEDSLQQRTFGAAAQHWRVVLNDLCQLPNFRRPTDEPHTFAECVPLSRFNDGHDGGFRSDLGVWRLRECPEKMEFVMINQLCISEESVRLHRELCEDPQIAPNFPEFCPPEDLSDAVRFFCQTSPHLFPF
jgi:hypothetical protein